MNNSKAEPFITAIIPTYRRPKLLRRAVLSVLNQTYHHIRVCVYDNASGDETEEVVAELMQKDSRVTYHRHSENIGSYNNFNYGLQEVETPFFSLLSDDDVFVPEFFEKALEGFKQYPEAMLVCMPTIAVNSDLRVISGPPEVNYMKLHSAREALTGVINGSIPGKWSGILFRKEVRDSIGLIDVQSGPFADAGYVMHAVARFPIVAVPGIAAVYVIYQNTTSAAVQFTPIGETWPGWWERMIGVIEKDEMAPAFARSKIRGLAYPDFRKMASRQVFYFLGEKRSDLAGQAAAGLKKCGHSVIANLLKAAVWSYDNSAAIRKLLAIAVGVKRQSTQKRRDILHMKYGHLVEFMKEI
jgi:glycosyltransferase involved in cell wall biosynthesis